MNFNEVMKRIEELEKKEEDLKNELYFTEREEEDMFTFLNICSVFDISLVQIISELLTLKEEEVFVPFMYKKYSSIFTNSEYSAENTCLGITKDEYLPRFNKTKNIDELFKQKCGYDMICLNTELLEKEKEKINPCFEIYNIPESYRKNVFAFDFLQKEIGSSAEAFPVRVCQSNFEEYKYIQDYIRYIFDLQLQRNGLRLNYEELKKAMNDFLENSKVKTKKLNVK